MAPGRHGDAPRETSAGGEIGPGDCLGRYTVRALLGAGGMGQVYEGYDPELQRVVALKLLRGGRVAASPRLRARLLREAQALARLRHPNVVTVYDVGAHDDQLFIAMALVEGATVADWLRAQPRSWREVRRTLAALPFPTQDLPAVERWLDRSVRR